MKIILITQGVSRIVYPLLSSDHQVIAVIESAPRDYKKNKKQGLIWNFAKTIYKAFSKSTITLEQLCSNKSIPYKFMLSSDDNGLDDWIKSLSPDLIVVFSMSSLLKRKIFDIPKHGTINLHPAYLPDYRGPNPCFWQYLNMEMQPGVTVHYINDGEDDGDIIFQDRVTIPIGIKSPERLDKLVGELGVSLITRSLDAIENGTAPRIKQPKTSSTIRARNLKPEEHESIIDWNNWDGNKVWHLLRGTESWLNAFPQPRGIFRGNRWSIDEYIETPILSKKPGTLFKRNGEYFIATRNGRIRLSCKLRLKNLIMSFSHR